MVGVGGGVQVTVKFVELVPVSPPYVTDIVPVVAPSGTLVVISVAEAASTTAVTPLNFTVLLFRTVLKPVPVITTVVPGLPGRPEVGENDVTVGAACAT